MRRMWICRMRRMPSSHKLLHAKWRHTPPTLNPLPPSRILPPSRMCKIQGVRPYRFFNGADVPAFFMEIADKNLGASWGVGSTLGRPKRSKSAAIHPRPPSIPPIPPHELTYPLLSSVGHSHEGALANHVRRRLHHPSWDASIIARVFLGGCS